MNYSGRCTRTIIQIAVACLGIFLTSLPSFSQGDAGRIQGSVLDQEGLAVEGATIVVTDALRGTSRTLVTTPQETQRPQPDPQHL